MRVHLIPLLGAVVVLCPPAHAELAREYRALLAAADVRQTDEEFLATAELVAAVAPGGREAVREAVAELLPRRLDVLRAWDATAVQTVPLEPQIVQSARRGEPQVEVVDVTAPEDAVPAASAAPAAEDRSAPAVTVTDAAGRRRGNRTPLVGLCRVVPPPSLGRARQGRCCARPGQYRPVRLFSRDRSEPGPSMAAGAWMARPSTITPRTMAM